MSGAGIDLGRREFTSAVAALVATAGLGTVEAEAAIEDQFDSHEAAEAAKADEVRVVAGLEDERDQVMADLEGDDYYNVLFEAVDTGNRYLSLHGNDWSPIQMFPQTQVEEVRTENYQSFFNHTFARPEAPDDKNWSYTDADVTKQGSEIELASTTTLESHQRGNYPAGSEAVPGVAWRTTDTPTGGTAEAGYIDDSNGVAVGEDATDSYVLLRKGGTDKKVYREDWNQHVPGGRVWDDNRPVITRFPHLFYGGGDVNVRALLHGEDDSELRTLHTFTADNIDDTFGAGPPINQPNLPARFESDSLTGANLRANAAHYEFGEVNADERVNGEHFGPVTAGTTGWTPLIAWRKRSAWEMVNVKPLKINVAATTNDARIAVQLDATTSGGTWELPTNTSSDETAIEVNTGVTLDAVGERRWVGFAAAGQGSNAGGTTQAKLDFNLPVGQDVVLAAQGVGGDADLSGVIAVEEFF